MTGQYGWKHGFPVSVGFHPQSLIIFVYRDPIDWLVSMYNRPYAASACVDFSSFSTFIRSEWGSYLRAQSYKNWSQKWNATIVKGLDGAECALDRHPITGERFRTPMELRTVKLQSGLSMANRGCNFVAVSYENVRQNKEAFVEFIKTFAHVSGPDDFDSIIETVSPTTATKRQFQKAQILSSDMEYVLDRLDHKLEQTLGYTVDR
jgi:hypothetical protein